MTFRLALNQGDLDPITGPRNLMHLENSLKIVEHDTKTTIFKVGRLKGAQRHRSPVWEHRPNNQHHCRIGTKMLGPAMMPLSLSLFLSPLQSVKSVGWMWAGNIFRAGPGRCVWMVIYLQFVATKKLGNFLQMQPVQVRYQMTKDANIMETQEPGWFRKLGPGDFRLWMTQIPSGWLIEDSLPSATNSLQIFNDIYRLYNHGISYHVIWKVVYQYVLFLDILTI